MEIDLSGLVNMKKTKDGRFVDKRVKIPVNLLDKILMGCKAGEYGTWGKLARKLGVSTYTLRYDWRKGNTIPLSILKQIIKMQSDIGFDDIKESIELKSSFWGQKIGIKSKYSQKVTLPTKHSPEFAELFGILLGDGCIYSTGSGFCISGNSILDNHYLTNYVSKLIVKVFGLEPKIYYSKKGKTIRLLVYSKEIVNFLISKGFPKGKKKNQNIHIPPAFFEDMTLLKACLRGLFDTDGSLYPQSNSKIVLEFSICATALFKSTLSAFLLLGIYTKSSRDRIYFCGAKNVSALLGCIGSSNMKHISKHITFCKSGVVPRSLEIEKLFKREQVPNIDIPYYGPMV